MPLVKTLLDDQNFLEFYVTAKKDTYAVGGDGKAETLRNGGKRYVFYDGERWPQWRYTDIYHGYNPFFGNEAVEEISGTDPSVWAPIAAMSYYGYANADSGMVRRIFTFVQEELKTVSTKMPFRGSNDFFDKNKDMFYGCRWDRKDPYTVSGEEYADLQETVGLARYQLYFLFCCLR